MKTLSFIRIILVLVVVGLVGCSAPSLAPTAVYIPIANTSALQQVFQIGHSDVVYSVAFSPDGRFALSGSSDKTMKLWEVATGREMRTFTGHSDLVTSVAFSPDGSFALSGSGADDKTIKLWEVATGKELRTFTGHSYTISKVAFSPDGRFIFSGSLDNTMKLWEVISGKVLRELKPSHDARSFDFSRDGHLAFVGGHGALSLWKIPTGELLYARTLDGNAPYNWIKSVAISPDGRLAISGHEAAGSSSDFTPKRNLKLWNLGTGDELYTFLGHSEGITEVTFSPNGRMILSACWSNYNKKNASKLWDISTGKELRNFDESSGIASMAFSPDGQFVLFGTNDPKNHYMSHWNVDTGKMLHKFEGHSDAITSIAASPDDGAILFGDSNGIIKLWSIANGTILRAFSGHLGKITSIAFSLNGRFAVSGSMFDSGSWNNGTVKLWDVLTGKLRRTWDYYNIHSVAFSPSNNSILATDCINFVNCRIKLLDIHAEKEIHTFEGHKNFIDSLAFSRDGRLAVSGSWDNTIKIWDIGLKKELRTLTGHINWVRSVAFSPDGRFVLSGGWDKILILWDVVTGQKIRTFSGHTEGINSVALSLDGRLALSGSDDNTLKLWDMATGMEQYTLAGHSGKVTSAVFSQNSLWIYSGSEDGTIRIWNVASRQEVARMISTRDGEWSISTPDGYYNTSPEGKSAVHYATDAATYGFEQFESLFRRPDIIKARLAGDLTAGTPAPKLTRPPLITADQTRSIQTTTDQATYPLAVTTTSQDDVVKTVRVFVNGKPAIEQPVDAKEQHLNFTVPLFAGPNRITTVAYDSKGFSSNQESIDIVSTVPGAAKPTLYVMAAGVSAYPNMPAANQLEYAHTDANALVQTLRAQKGQLFQDVRDFTLVNQEVTPQQLEAGLTALSAMDANDIAVIFLAGHGVQGKDGKFWYVTPQGSMEHPEQGGIDWQILGERISHIKGRVILLLNACHSGSITDETIVPNDQLAAKFFQGGMGGVMVFSASKGHQSAFEGPDYGSGFGAFAYALTQGLGPKATEADKDNNGFVEFMELVDYVSKFVNTLTAGQQTPWLSRKELFGDLAIATVKKGE